jgi:hypothetical protein
MARGNSCGKYVMHYPVVKGPAGVRFGTRRGRVMYGAYAHNQLGFFSGMGNAEGFLWGGSILPRDRPRKKRPAPEPRFPWDEREMDPRQKLPRSRPSAPRPGPYLPGVVGKPRGY